MTTAQWTRVEALFEAALDRPSEGRSDWLDAACEDEALRREVHAMLAAHDRSAPFLEEPVRVAAAALVAEAVADDDAGRRVGPYRLVEELGRGGMGVVYLAERADGQYEQRVAVKLLRRDFRTDAFRDRFLAERQILAGLTHPNIARLLDGGVTDDGRPFYVMEYVQGRPLDRYCDEARLGVEARLRLFVQVCEAVAYAHRNLVVHRDLKPSNVLVTDDGVVKLLDFGIAKLLAAEDARPMVTRTAQRLFTPAYAAPEQVRGAPVSTSTDVYALGVLLYVLLTGRRPLRLHGRGHRAVEQAILDEAPTAPSGVVERAEEETGPDGAVITVTPAEVGGARGTDPARLRRRLRGDLDRIVLQALRKEPERRYPGAEALARDVERHLRSLPVEARPATVGYRVASFVRRHRAGVAATAAVVVLAALFGSAYTLRVTDERNRAEAAAARAERVSAFLTDLLARAEEADADRVAILRLLEPAVAEVEAELPDQPDARAALYHTLGRLYHVLGRPDRADSLLRRAVTLRRALYDAPHEDLARVLHDYGLLLLATQRDSAFVAFRDAARMRRALYDGDHHDLAWSLLQSARMLPVGHPEKDARYEEALAMLQRLHGERSPEVAEAIHEYHVLGLSGASPEETEAAFREALAIYEENGMEHLPTAIHALHNLGLLLDGQGDEEGIRLLRRSVERGHATFSEGHSPFVTMRVNYGATLHEHGRLDEADAVLREVAESTRRVFGDRGDRFGHSHYWYGRNLLALGRAAEGEAALREALGVYRRLQPDGGHRHRVQIEHAKALVELGRYGEAEASLRESAEAMRGTGLERLALERLLRLYEATGRPAERARIRVRLDELGA